MMFTVFIKSLREAARRPLYLGTLLGIPMALMLIFGLALEEDSDDDAIEGAALLASADDPFDDHSGAGEAGLLSIRTATPEPTLPRDGFTPPLPEHEDEADSQAPDAPEDEPVWTWDWSSWGWTGDSGWNDGGSSSGEDSRWGDRGRGGWN